MKRILLMGNPNVGKSAVFSRLTGVKVIASNYPGTTVEFTQGMMKVGDESRFLVDAPGIYGLEATSKAEEIALSMLKEGGLVINVVDATNLERSLNLTLNLLEQNVPMIIALNIWDDAKHKGIEIDVAKMEELLGVPVVPTVAVSGEGFKELVSRIPEAKNRPDPRRSEEERWTEVGRIVSQVQSLQHRHHTFLEMLGDASVKPRTGLPIAAALAFVAFKVVRFVGEGLIDYVFDPVFENLVAPLVMRLSPYLGPGSLLHSVVIGKLIDGNIDFLQSFGLLTTGLYVPIAMVLPYVFSFYLVLGFLEDFGYLPRLAVLLDNMMHHMGLHGWAVIPSFLGMGCNVPGIMATRILESERERFIAATVISIGVPCASLQAMIFGLLGEKGGGYVGIVYLTLFLVWVVLGVILNNILSGPSPTLIMEVPPYRMPSASVVIKKLWMRMTGFIKEALPIVFLGVLIVDLLYFLGVFDVIANFTAPLMTGVFGLPKEAIIALVVGFLRKDVAVGMLGTLDLSAEQLVVAAVVLSMFFPCIATFVVLFKELGLKNGLKSVGIMIVTSIIVGGTLNVIL